MKGIVVELERNEHDTQNTEYHAMVIESRNIVLGHPIFEGVDRESPPSIKDGGACAPFDQKAFATAIAGNLGFYTCAINLLWVDLA